MEELLRNMDWELFEKQKQWLADQVAALIPAGTEASDLPEGVLNMMDRIQEAWEDEKQEDALRMITVKTPKGTIMARESSDKEYPGIALVYSEPGSGEPGAIMEYNPNKDAVMLMAWDKDHVDDDPIFVREMSE